MAALLDSEEEWSESELFDEAADGQSRRLRPGVHSHSQGEVLGVSPAPVGLAAARSQTLKLRAVHPEQSARSSGEEGPLEEATRYGLRTTRCSIRAFCVNCKGRGCTTLHLPACRSQNPTTMPTGGSTTNP